MSGLQAASRTSGPRTDQSKGGDRRSPLAPGTGRTWSSSMIGPRRAMTPSCTAAGLKCRRHGCLDFQHVGSCGRPCSRRGPCSRRRPCSRRGPCTHENMARRTGEPRSPCLHKGTCGNRGVIILARNDQSAHPLIIPRQSSSSVPKNDDQRRNCRIAKHGMMGREWDVRGSSHGLTGTDNYSVAFIIY